MTKRKLALLQNIERLDKITSLDREIIPDYRMHVEGKGIDAMVRVYVGSSDYRLYFA